MQPREAAASRSEMQPREAVNQQPVVAEAIVRSQAIRDRRCQRSSGEQIGDATARSNSQQIGDATARTSSQQSPTRSCEAKPSLQPWHADGICSTSTATACCRWLHRLPQPLQLNSPPHLLSPSFSWCICCNYLKWRPGPIKPKDTQRSELNQKGTINFAVSIFHHTTDRRRRRRSIDRKG